MPCCNAVQAGDSTLPNKSYSASRPLHRLALSQLGRLAMAFGFHGPSGPATRDLPPSNNNKTRSNPPAWTTRSTDNRDSPFASHTPFSNYNSSSAFLHSHSRQQRREDGTPATSAAHACSEANTLNSDVMKNQVTPSEDHVDMTGDDGIIQTHLQSLPTSLRAKWRDMCRDEAVKSGTVTGESSDASTREA